MFCQRWECIQLRQSLARFAWRATLALIITLLLVVVLSVIDSIREDYDAVNFRSAVESPKPLGGRGAAPSHSQVVAFMDGQRRTRAARCFHLLGGTAPSPLKIRVQNKVCGGTVIAFEGGRSRTAAFTAVAYGPTLRATAGTHFVASQAASNRRRSG
jgi:hypothetical protein